MNRALNKDQEDLINAEVGIQSLKRLISDAEEELKQSVRQRTRTIMKSPDKEDDINDLYVITLTDNTECCVDALQKLRVALDDEYVDSAGLMKGANKGLKEMRISAAWLRAIKDESACVNVLMPECEDAGYIRRNKLRAPIFYARIAIDENLVEHLQYVFCLCSPLSLSASLPPYV